MNSDSLLPLSPLAALQDDLLRFVREEHAAQRETLQASWARSVAERVADGRCIDRLSLQDFGPKGHCRLRCPANDSRFREGDHVRISRGDPLKPMGEAIMVVAGDTEVELKLTSSATKDALAACPTGLCLDETAIDLEKLYLAALEDLGQTQVGRGKILPLLDGSLRPALDAEEVDAAAAEAGAAGFDDQQAEAIANACATDLCWLVHGPPGTGKTRVLARIAARLLAGGERVLVTSFTHRAINHALAAITEVVPDRRLVARIAPYLDSAVPVQQFENFSESPFTRSGDAYIIGATPFSLRSRRLRGVDFDTVIVDEASQVTIPLAIMAMLAGKRFIFAGDHRQLPPVSLTRPPREAVKLSIFGRLVGRGFDTLLPVTRRLNDQLCRWPSEAFYASRLVPHETAAPRRLVLARQETEFAAALAPESSCIWLAVPHRGARTAAMEEVTLITDLLLALGVGGTDWRDIGVVVPFRRQARLLRRHLAQKVRERSEDVTGLVVDTVERMQGQEREVVILSFATSDFEFAARMKDFLFQPQRLNVAATRARTKLIIVASPELLRFAESQPDDEDLGKFVDLLHSARRIDVALPASTDDSAG